MVKWKIHLIAGLTLITYLKYLCEKRCIFQITGMMYYLVYKSIAEPLIALNASGLYWVPVLEWDLSFGMTI